MATAPVSAGSAKILVRKIGAADLSASLKAGWDDFMAMRGDLIFLGLLYPLIGFAAAVFTLKMVRSCRSFSRWSPEWGCWARSPRSVSTSSRGAARPA